MLWLIVEFLMFVASAGLLFNERFRRNFFAVGVAGCVGLISSYFLTETLLERAGYLRLSQQMNADAIFWWSIKDSAVSTLFDQFIIKFPKSEHMAEARARSEELKAKQAAVERQIQEKVAIDKQAEIERQRQVALKREQANHISQVPVQRPSATNALPPEAQLEPEVEGYDSLLPKFKKQLVEYSTREPPGYIVLDRQQYFLYLVLGGGKALRYGMAIGRRCADQSGQRIVSRMAEWADWKPSLSARKSQPGLPGFMAGGPGNPLGARAIYLGSTGDIIHGTSHPSTIGGIISTGMSAEGCFQLLNADVEDLYERIQVGSKVVISN